MNMVCYGILMIFLSASFAIDHPSSCTLAANGEDNTALGLLLENLLWTADACLLMTILGWVTIAVGYAIAVYLGYMYLCFWRQLREAGADARAVERAIAVLPVLQHKGKDTEFPLLDGHEPSETCTCVICLCDFEEGEQLRLLPCVHLFHKPCIDA